MRHVSYLCGININLFYATCLTLVRCISLTASFMVVFGQTRHFFRANVRSVFSSRQVLCLSGILFCGRRQLWYWGNMQHMLCLSVRHSQSLSQSISRQSVRHSVSQWGSHSVSQTVSQALSQSGSQSINQSVRH